jgi:hypothetical protein
MPEDTDLPGDDRTRESISGEPLTASVRDILDEHAEAQRRADEERRADEAERERAVRRKAEEERTILRHTGGKRRLRPRRDAQPRRGVAGGVEGGDDTADVDPRLIAAGVFAGVVLAGGVRRVLVLAVVAAGAWALYQRVLAPARDPAAVLQ